MDRELKLLERSSKETTELQNYYSDYKNILEQNRFRPLPQPLRKKTTLLKKIKKKTLINEEKIQILSVEIWNGEDKKVDMKYINNYDKELPDSFYYITKNIYTKT